MVGSYDKCYYNQVIKRNQLITLNHNINITKTDYFFSTYFNLNPEGHLIDRQEGNFLHLEVSA